MDQETVDVGSINSFKGRLDKIRKTRMGFYGSRMVHKALGLMEIGPREATQGELQGELHMARMYRPIGSVTWAPIIHCGP